MKLAVRFAVVALLAGTVPCFASDATAIAEKTLMQGHADDAVAMLHTIVADDPNNGRAHLLLCRAFYAEEMIVTAVTECELAVKALQSSEAQDWMGRAYGMRANNAGPIQGLRLARRVKAAFEAAVQVDPKNPDAANDLGEFYIEAPSLIGGGLDKAEALASGVQQTMPQVTHRLRALIAQHEKDYATAETEFRAAVGVAGKPDAWADLGQFYALRKDSDKAVDAIKHCLAADRLDDASLVDAAGVLNIVHREPQMAEKALRTYLDRGLKTDAQPVFKVYTDLGRMLAEQGDKAAAKVEFGKALELASSYGPAQRALKNL